MSTTSSMKVDCRPSDSRWVAALPASQSAGENGEGGGPAVDLTILSDLKTLNFNSSSIKGVRVAGRPKIPFFCPDVDLTVLANLKTFNFII